MEELKTYDVLVNYRTLESSVITTGSITVRRNAFNAGKAIVAVVSVLASLSNDDEMYFEITSVSASRVMPVSEV